MHLVVDCRPNSRAGEREKKKPLEELGRQTADFFFTPHPPPTATSGAAFGVALVVPMSVGCSPFSGMGSGSAQATAASSRTADSSRRNWNLILALGKLLVCTLW